MVSQSKWETYKYNETIATSATCGAGTAYPSRAPEIDHQFLVVFVLLDLLFSV